MVGVADPKVAIKNALIPLTMKHYCNSSRIQNQVNEIMSRNGIPIPFIANDFRKVFEKTVKLGIRIEALPYQT